MKIAVTQTRQIGQFEPRRIEIQFDTKEDVRPQEEVVHEIIDKLDYFLYPENHVEFHQDPPSEVEEDEF